MAFKKYRLNPRVIDDLKKRSYIGNVFYLLILYIVLYTGDYYDRHPDFSNQMTFFIAGISLFRIFHLPIAKWMEPKFIKFNDTVFIFSVLLTSFLWGIFFAKFMLQGGDANTNLLMVMCTIGLSSGAAVAFYPDLRVSVIFSFFMLLPAIFVMVLHSMDMALTISFILMFLYLCFMAFRGNREYWSALENEYLLEQKSKDMEKISRIDGLTGLYNRRYFDEVYAFEWNRSIRKQQPISIILADIDHFKKINDQFGHLAGDEYLKDVSRLFKQIFKRKIDIIARYGGEEFIVLMPGESDLNANEMAENIRKKLEIYMLEHEGRTIQATMSLGVASCTPQKDQEPQELISKADGALYQSKSDGRNRISIGR